MSHYHYASPNYSIMNFVIGWCVYFCLRNLWAIPTSFDRTNSEQVNFSLMLPNQITTLPVQMINGRRTILISPLFAEENNDIITETTATFQLRPTQKGLAPQEQNEEIPTVTNLRNRMDRMQRQVHRYKMNAPATSTTTPTKPSSHQAIRRNDTSRRSLITSTTMPPMTRIAASSATKQQQQQQQHRSGQSTIVLLVFSFTFVAGGLFAKRALGRYEKWEMQSQEDSLAYDIAYTMTNSSNISSYGSMGDGSSSWSVEMSKYDV